MRNKVLFPFLLCLVLLNVNFNFSQFSPEEIALRPKIEQYLKTAELIKAKEVGEGVTRPWRIFLKCPEGEISGCWKNPRGMQEGYLEGWQYEIAAYEMDKLVDLNMIPPTVERIFMGKKGSIQFWIENPMSDKNRMDQGINIPEEHLLRWTKYKYLMRAFDCLIGNEDRTQQNIRYDDEWNIILIDHSRSFRSTKKFTKNLPYGKKGVVEAQPFRFLPRAFVEKIKGLTFEEIRGAVGDYLSQKEINAVLKRRDLILAEIEEMIKEKGEKAVLY